MRVDHWASHYCVIFTTDVYVLWASVQSTGPFGPRATLHWANSSSPFFLLHVLYFWLLLVIPTHRSCVCRWEVNKRRRRARAIGSQLVMDACSKARSAVHVQASVPRLRKQKWLGSRRSRPVARMNPIQANQTTDGFGFRWASCQGRVASQPWVRQAYSSRDLLTLLPNPWGIRRLHVRGFRDNPGFLKKVSHNEPGKTLRTVRALPHDHENQSTWLETTTEGYSVCLFCMPFHFLHRRWWHWMTCSRNCTNVKF